MAVKISMRLESDWESSNMDFSAAATKASALYMAPVMLPNTQQAQPLTHPSATASLASSSLPVMEASR